MSRGTPTFKQIRQLLPRPIQRGDDDEIELDLWVIGDRPDRHAEKLVAAFRVEDGDRLESRFLERQVCELGRLAAAADGDALAGRRAVLQGGAQVLPHLAVEVQRVVHELVGQPRLLGNAARRHQVRDAIGLNVHHLDEALVHHPLEVDVGQTEGDAQLARQAALRHARVLVDRLEQP